jgi:ABC-type nitrate/sulfonate/bicarbonate transport system ATPase subunit
LIVIEADRVAKWFGRGGQQVTALDDFNLQVNSGEFLTVIGPSGCGKTTFLMIAAGLETVCSGTMRYHGNPVVNGSGRPGIVFQEFALFPWRTVADNIGFGPEIRGLSGSDRRAIVDRYLDLIDLRGFERKYPAQLSGGMRQRVAIARALANDPDLLLMDEPFGSLDALTRDMMQTELLRIWQKTKNTIVFVTHNIHEAVYLGDRVAVMSKRPGRIKTVISVDLPRPRNEAMTLTPAFLRCMRDLKQLVYEEVTS